MGVGESKLEILGEIWVSSWELSLVCVVKLAIASKSGHGELLSTATHGFGVSDIRGRSEWFQTNSFDVIKCI